MFNYVHLVEIKKGFGSMSKEKRRKSKIGEKEHAEHVLVLIFLGMMCMICIFLIFFPKTRLFKEKFRLLNHLIRISIKIVMIFGSWLLC